MAKRPTSSNDPYGDSVSDDEQTELDKLMKSNDVPEPDDSQQAGQGGEGDEHDDDGGDDRGQGDEDAGKPKAKPAAVEGEGDEGDDDSGTVDPELASFLEKHKGKSPEELARLAFQQQKRAGKAEFDSRKAGDNLNAVLTRIQEARDAKLNRIAETRTAFEKKVADDPDAALIEARTATLTAEEQAAKDEADALEFDARADAAIAMASQAIPEFATRAPAIRAFGHEMGFAPEEVDGMVDGRQIITLYLASIAGNMIKAGLIDSSGKFKNLPTPVVEQTGDKGEGQRRRAGFSRTPARGANAQKSLEDQLAEISAMTDADFDKLDPAALERLLRDAELEA